MEGDFAHALRSTLRGLRSGNRRMASRVMAESPNPDRGLAAARSAVEAKSWLEVVGRQVAELEFGSVQITVYGGRVVQIETSVKVRFDKP